MRKISIVLAVLLALLIVSACVQEGDVSKDASLTSESVPQQDESETSADSLVTEEWENTTKENGDTVLRKYTKEYNGDESNYTLTAMKYTNGEFTEKIITVYTDGKKTHDETYRYTEMFFFTAIKAIMSRALLFQSLRRGILWTNMTATTLITNMSIRILRTVR